MAFDVVPSGEIPRREAVMVFVDVRTLKQGPNTGCATKKTMVAETDPKAWGAVRGRILFLYLSDALF